MRLSKYLTISIVGMNVRISAGERKLEQEANDRRNETVKFHIISEKARELFMSLFSDDEFLSRTHTTSQICAYRHLQIPPCWIQWNHIWSCCRDGVGKWKTKKRKENFLFWKRKENDKNPRNRKLILLTWYVLSWTPQENLCGWLLGDECVGGVIYIPHGLQQSSPSDPLTISSIFIWGKREEIAFVMAMLAPRYGLLTTADCSHQRFNCHLCNKTA